MDIKLISDIHNSFLNRDFVNILCCEIIYRQKLINWSRIKNLKHQSLDKAFVMCSLIKSIKK